MWDSLRNVAMFSNVAKSAASHNKLASDLILNATLLQKVSRKGLESLLKSWRGLHIILLIPAKLNKLQVKLGKGFNHVRSVSPES